MQRNLILESYFEKQKSFKNLVKDIQISLQSKEYKQTNYSIEEFIKNKWNISKAQAYRYLISAKVIDQLEEFYIQPCYERICRSLYNCAKTPSQMKLLWGSILQTSGDRPDCINSSHVNKMWKKLCADKKYYKICHYEDIIINKVELSLNKHSKEIKHKQLNKNNNKNGCNKKENLKKNNLNSNQFPIFNIPVNPSYNPLNIQNEPIKYEVSSSYYHSPNLSELSISSNENNQYSNSSSPSVASNSNLYSEINNNQINSNNLSIPSNSNIRVHYPLPPVINKNSILYLNHQETIPSQPQQIYYY